MIGYFPAPKIAVNGKSPTQMSRAWVDVYIKYTEMKVINRQLESLLNCLSCAILGLDKILAGFAVENPAVSNEARCKA